MSASQSQALEASVLEASARSSCLHCDLPLGTRPVGDFCCQGCAAVHALLQGEDLERFYDLRRGPGTPVVDLPSPTRELDWLDEARVEAQGETLREGELHLRMDIQGIHCSGCVWILEKTFQKHEGAIKLLVNPAVGRVDLWASEDFPVEMWLRSVERFGYRFGPALKERSATSDGLLLRLGVCVAIAMNVMFLSASLYVGLEEGPIYELVRTLSFGLAGLSVAIGGPVFFRSAYLGLRNGVLHLDVPISLGIILAFAGSTYGFLSGTDDMLYLDSVSAFIALMLIGRYLQERVLAANRNRLLANKGASSLRSKRLEEGVPVTVKSMELSRGDRLLIAPGELIPVSALLENEEAEISTEWINGESRSHRVKSGAELVAGSFNAGMSPLRVTATEDFQESALEELLRPSSTVEVAAHETGLAKAISSYYVSFVLLAAAMGGVGWLYLGPSPAAALQVVIAVLVVTCPCAFGIATPLANELVLERLRRIGLYVRNGDFLSRASKIESVVFDKTGTLTTGAVELANPQLLAELSDVERGALHTLSSQSRHPASAAIARALAPYGLPIDESWKVEELSGRGVQARVGDVLYRLGRADWALDSSEALSGTVLSKNGTLIESFELSEEARADAEQELRALREEGYAIHVLSGDRDDKVKELADELGIQSEAALGEQDPKQKQAWLHRHGAENTLFLGDGINDVLAAQEASCSGTPAVDLPFMASHCDFYLGTAGLAPVRQALHASRRLAAVIRRNLAFALVYNLGAIAIAWAGLMKPWLAAVLMPTSSILIVLATTYSLSPRSRHWKF